MNLTLHEVAHLVRAKNDISQFEDVALVKPEFDRSEERRVGKEC